MEQQLHSTLLELKSTQAIISLLREDIRNAGQAASMDIQTPTQTVETTRYDQAIQPRKTVLHNTNIKKSPVPKKVNMKYPYKSTNRLLPLTNLNRGTQAEENRTCKGDLPPDTHHQIRTSTQHCHGSRIPTIMNGRIKHIDNKKSTRKPSNTLCDSKPESKKLKVNIIGDSHLKGAMIRINQYLNTKFEVFSFIKPGACVSQLVHSQENELKSLGKSDVIVINGRSNDTDKPGCNINVILSKLIHFIMNYNNTNILMVTMPFRHDLAPTSKINVFIRAFNSKIKNITKAFKHVSVIDMSSDRSHFTRHSFHMNSFGKERFAKQVASQIEILTKLSNNSKSAIPL